MLNLIPVSNFFFFFFDPTIKFIYLNIHLKMAKTSKFTNNSDSKLRMKKKVLFDLEIIRWFSAR